MSTVNYSDDAKVEWMHLRTKGLTCPEIGKLYGVSGTYIRASTNRIVKDDAKHHTDKIVFV
jgi:hypothetical protein